MHDLDVRLKSLLDYYSNLKAGPLKRSIIGELIKIGRMRSNDDPIKKQLIEKWEKQRNDSDI